MSERKHDESAEDRRAARLIARAEAVFGNAETAQRWPSKPNEQMNSLSPNEAMQDERGAALVDQLLKRIDSGYF